MISVPGPVAPAAVVVAVAAAVVVQSPVTSARRKDSQRRLRTAWRSSSRLDGGLRVVTESMPHAIAIGAWIGVGNRDEPAELAGVTLLEHLLFKGSSLDPHRTSLRASMPWVVISTRYVKVHLSLGFLPGNSTSV